MTSRERVLAAVNGGEVDRKPVIAWPKSNRDADMQVHPAGDIREGGEPRDAVLALVPNLFRRFELMGEDPVAFLKNTDKEIVGIVDEAEDLSRREARRAIDSGAVGVFYEIHGATASQCTPMEYGGLFLEKDRAFLESISDAPCNVVYIDGREPYLDFVSDLPAKAFGWDVVGSGISVSDVRNIREGALMADDPEADISMTSIGSTTEFLEGCLTNV
jgi:hypothetical protein